MYTWVKVFRIITGFRILRLSLKMLNFVDNNYFSDLVSVYLKVFAHFAWNFNILEAYSKFKF